MFAGNFSISSVLCLYLEVSNYDIIAPFYDSLSRIIFGNKLKKSQLYLIEQIQPGTSILIVGGGAGWILEAVASHCDQGLSITYIDSSATMIALAKRRDAGNNVVNFITAKVENIPLPEKYDYVFTAFLFDNFKQDLCGRIFYKIADNLRPGGLWLYADFANTNNRVHRFLLKSMFVFFWLFCGIESRKLPVMESLFSNRQYRNKQTKNWMSGFIKAQVFEKLD